MVPVPRPVARVLSGLAFAAVPLGVVAPKALTLVVIVGGLVGLWHWWSTERTWTRRPGPVGLALAALIVWSAVSAAWSGDSGGAAGLALRLGLLHFAGLMLMVAVRGLDAPERRQVTRALLAGYALGLAALGVGFGYARWTGESLWGTYFHDPLTTLNNGAVIAALLFWPVGSVLWRWGRRALAVGLAVAVIAGLMFLSSGAALLALASGGVAFVIVWACQRRGAVFLAAALALMMFTAPLIARTLTQHMGTTVSVQDERMPFSVQHRLAMWAFVDEKITQKPILGWGLDAARSIPQDDRRLLSNMELMPLHPHNAALQVWLELGVPGAIIAAALVFLVIRGTAAAGARGGAAVLAAAAVSYIAVGAVAFGVWQNWWIAAAWILAAMTSVAARDGEGSP